MKLDGCWEKIRAAWKSTLVQPGDLAKSSHWTSQCSLRCRRRSASSGRRSSGASVERTCSPSPRRGASGAGGLEDCVFESRPSAARLARFVSDKRHLGDIHFQGPPTDASRIAACLPHT